MCASKTPPRESETVFAHGNHGQTTIGNCDHAVALGFKKSRINHTRPGRAIA